MSQQMKMEKITEDKENAPAITYTRSVSYKRHDTVTTECEENTHLGKTPAFVTCQFCYKEVETQVEEQSAKEMYSNEDWYMNNCGYATMLLCSPIWLFLPCLYLFSRKPWRMTTHKCPICNVYIGVHSGKKTRLFRNSGAPAVQFAELKARKRQRMSSI